MVSLDRAYRRRGSRRGGPRGGGAVKALVGLAGISNPLALQTANPGGIAGTAAGFCVYGLVRVLASANGNYWFTRIAAAAGWGVLQSSATQVVFRCADGTTALVSSAAYTVTGDVGKVLGFVGVHTGTNLQLWVNNAQVGSDQAITGFTANSNRSYIGAAGAATGFIDWFGCGTATAVPSGANIAAWFAAVKSAKSMQRMPGITSDHLWVPQAAAAVPDQIGSDTLSLVGAGHSVVKLVNPTWGW